MKKKLNQKFSMFIIFFVISVAFLVVLVINTRDSDKVCFERTCFKVEKAVSQQEHETGLMKRDYLAENKGMIFIFDKESIYAFWMKNTLIPLDMIWINSSDDVVFIKEYAQPCGEICTPIVPPENATYVLEINGGLSEKYDISIGDKVKIY